MSEILCSVGLDVGTTTTQLIVSEIKAENKASAFSVPEMEITGRKILYTSPVHFTPLLSGELVDGDKLRNLVKAEYEKAGITPQSVDTRGGDHHRGDLPEGKCCPGAEIPF